MLAGGFYHLPISQQKALSPQPKVSPQSKPLKPQAIIRSEGLKPISFILPCIKDQKSRIQQTPQHFPLVIYVYSGGLDGCWLVVFIVCPFPYLWFETRAVPWRPCPEICPQRALQKANTFKYTFPTFGSAAVYTHRCTGFDIHESVQFPKMSVNQQYNSRHFCQDTMPLKETRYFGHL